MSTAITYASKRNPRLLVERLALDKLRIRFHIPGEDFLLIARGSEVESREDGTAVFSKAWSPEHESFQVLKICIRNPEPRVNTVVEAAPKAGLPASLNIQPLKQCTIYRWSDSHQYVAFKWRDVSAKKNVKLNHQHVLVPKSAEILDVVQAFRPGVTCHQLRHATKTFIFTNVQQKTIGDVVEANKTVLLDFGLGLPPDNAKFPLRLL